MEIFKKDDEYFGYGSLVCFAFLEPVVSWVLNCAVAVSKGFPQILHQHSNDAQSDTYKNSWKQADSLFFRNRKWWCFTQPICYSHGRSVIFKHGEVKTIVQVTLNWSWYNDVHKRRSMKGSCDWFKIFSFVIDWVEYRNKGDVWVREVATCIMFCNNCSFIFIYLFLFFIKFDWDFSFSQKYFLCMREKERHK